MEKQPLDELLKTYKVRLKTSLKMLDETEAERDKERLRIQIACYRTFIEELEEAIQ